MKRSLSARAAGLGAATAVVTALTRGLAASSATAAAAFPATPLAAGSGHPVTAYVANFYSGTVTPIRTATNTALKAIKVSGTPYAIAITPDGKTAYVTGGKSATVTPINTATNTALAPIKVAGTS
jgi:YVTN family beta-propeller protein